MTFYETIVPLEEYRAHEIKEIEVIAERPFYGSSNCSALLKVFTESGKVFWTDRVHLDDMQIHPDWYPVGKAEFAPAQKGSGAG